MPRKPDQATIDAANAKLDPREVLQVIVNETPELRDALLERGLVKEVENA